MADGMIESLKVRIARLALDAGFAGIQAEYPTAEVVSSPDLRMSRIVRVNTEDGPRYFHLRVAEPGGPRPGK